MAQITRYTDPYNPIKVWLVKKYSDRTYRLSQEISGRQIYPFRRWAKAQIAKTVPGFTG